MESIWVSLIGTSEESKALINTHLQILLRAMLDTLNSGKWKERQASAAALCDLLPGRPRSEVGGGGGVSVMAAIFDFTNSTPIMSFSW